MESKGLTVGKIITNRQPLSETPPPEDTFPPIPANLLSVLEGLYPLSRPDIRATEREIWFKYGQRSVVDFLIQRKEEEHNH